MATNQISFYYRKDLNVTKHGEYKAGTDMLMGDAVKRNETTLELELAANSAEFEGIVDKQLYNVQGSDTLELKKGERVRCGVGVDYEIVVKGNHPALGAMAAGDEVAVENGKFVAPTPDTNGPVGRIVEKFANEEVCIRIY